MGMTIKFKPWFHPFHPYRVEWRDLYLPLEIEGNKWPRRYETHYVLHKAASDWLLHARGVKFKHIDGPLYFAPEANGTKIVKVFHKDPPPLWFTRKSDALLMKLVLTGKLQ